MELPDMHALSCVHSQPMCFLLELTIIFEFTVYKSEPVLYQFSRPSFYSKKDYASHNSEFIFCYCFILYTKRKNGCRNHFTQKLLVNFKNWIWVINLGWQWLIISAGLGMLMWKSIHVTQVQSAVSVSVSVPIPLYLCVWQEFLYKEILLL